MNYGYGGGAYVNETVAVGGVRPYYNQPMIVQPSPQVVVVDNGYGYNNGYNNGAA